MSAERRTVAIVGGGFTGAAVAYHLARAGAPADIVLFEPRPRLGAGLAYGGADPTHRINVPASRMSLLPGDDGHFARWLAASGTLAADPEALAGGEAFARRQDFGRYIDETLRPLVNSGAVAWRRDVVAEVRREGTSWRIATSSGRVAAADLVVIATTHPPPSVPKELRTVVEDERLVADGLADEALAAVAPDDRVAVIGAGLTAADLVASLDGRGHRGSILMISRRGLRPRGHGAQVFPPEGDFVTEPARSATELLARVRRAVRKAEAAGRGWRPVIDGLRAQGSAVWAALPAQARRRIVRHLRPFWDVHRFRAAPQIDAVLDRKLADGSLEIVKGRLIEAAAAPSGLALTWRDRRGETATREFDRVLVATGPAHGEALQAQAYLRALAAQGFVALDPTGLGLRTSRDGRAIGVSGAPEPSLFVAGPLARGTFGELMGLPQVAVYAEFIADQASRALATMAPSVAAAPTPEQRRSLAAEGGRPGAASPP